MALKRIPKDMSYQALRHKHPPGPIKKADEPTSTKAPHDASETLAEKARKGQEESASVDAAESRRPPNRSKPSKPATPKETMEEETVVKPISGENVRIRGYVYLPSGPRFEQLAEIYGTGEALKLGLTSGMSAYESALSDSKPLGPPPRFEKAGRPVETSRMMAADLHAKAVEHVDPMRMLGKSQLGTRILNVALGYYLRGK